MGWERQPERGEGRSDETQEEAFPGREDEGWEGGLGATKPLAVLLWKESGGAGGRAGERAGVKCQV